MAVNFGGQSASIATEERPSRSGSTFEDKLQTDSNREHEDKLPGAPTSIPPRGRMSAYGFFLQTCREEHKEKQPDENIVFATFTKKCAERWNTMKEDENGPFYEMEEQDKKRYELEIQNYVPPPIEDEVETL